MSFCVFSVEVPVDEDCVIVAGRRMAGPHELWAHIQMAIQHRSRVLVDFGGNEYFPQVSGFIIVIPHYVILSDGQKLEIWPK